MELHNDTGAPIDLDGWSMRDRAGRGRRFVFPSVTLAPGEYLRLWSGAGADDATNLHWGRRQAVWTKTGDAAVLHDRRGVERRRLAIGNAPEPRPR